MVIYESAHSEQLLRIAAPLVIQGCALVRHFSYADQIQMRRSGHDPWIEMLAACAILALERTADEVEYLPSVLTPSERRTYRAVFSSSQRWARRIAP